MTFLEFKNRYRLATRGDIALSDDELKMLISISINDIVRTITPLELVEIDNRHFEIDYFLNEKYFVRKVEDVENDDDIIGLTDKMLLEALVYKVAYKRAFDPNLKAIYQREFRSYLTSYEMNNFDENSYDLDSALANRGWAKPYEIAHALDEFYTWDSQFIDNLDYFMANITSLPNLSYKKFIYLFIDYQNNKEKPSRHVMPLRANESLNRADLEALDKLMSEKIRGT